MKTKWIVSLIVTLLGVTALFYSKVAARDNNSQPDANFSVAGQAMLNATVLIAMKLEVSSSGGATEYVQERGIGSLVRYGQEIMLVTHNHWGNDLQDKTLVEISDAHNRKLVKLYGFQFLALVRYQDAGTLVLKAPDGLANETAASSLGDSRAVQVGDKVLVAYRQTPSRETATMLEAVVVGYSSYKGLPRYELRSQSGQSILPGDSGGGIWKDGKLVGNLWTTLLIKEVAVSGQPDGAEIQPTYSSSDTSFAAMFPMHARLDGASDMRAVVADNPQEETGASENGMQ